jgi:hypothetical protein
VIAVLLKMQLQSGAASCYFLGTRFKVGNVITKPGSCGTSWDASGIFVEPSLLHKIHIFKIGSVEVTMTIAVWYWVSWLMAMRMSRVLPTLGGCAHHLLAAPGTHENRKKKKLNDLLNAFNPSQNAIICLQMS